MLVVSDIHDAPGAMARLVAIGEPVLVLGDLVNLADYRTGEGAVAEVLGLEHSLRTGEARGRGDFGRMGELWRERIGDRGPDARREIGAVLRRQYEAMADAMAGGTGLVTHGNVDRVDLLVDHLPEGFKYVHGEVVEIDSITFGIVGGGVPTPMHVEGEVDDEEMEALLAGLGTVDVLCSHVPPALRPVRFDVVTGREERGSAPILEYIRREKPRLHLYGDVHQPQASTWRIGPTRCVNVGYFRATGRFFRVRPDGIQPDGLR
jgi:Icc-related predicted phosphoesterase